jgi:hypothetical protein
MTATVSPFEHAESFEAGEIAGVVRLGKFEAHYEELFAEVIEDGIITAEERDRLDRAAEALGLERDRLRKLELGLEAAYEARHRVPVRQALASPAASDDGEEASPQSIALELSPDPRIGAFERRIQQLEARIVELERELEEARAEALVNLDLNAITESSLPGEGMDDPEDLHRRLHRDPRDPDLLHALYRASGRQRDVDRQLCVAHALTFLLAGSADEHQFYQELRTEGLIKPRAAMEPGSWRRYLFHPEEEPLTGEIFAVVVGAVLLGRLDTLRRDRALPRLDPARRQDPRTSTLQAVRAFAWAAAILGMPAPPLYADPDFAGMVEIVPGVIPACRLGMQALRGRTSTELAFIAGQKLSFFREDHFVRALLPSIPELEEVFLAALSIGNPGLPLSAQMKARVAPVAQAIEPILEPAQIDRLRGHFLRFVEEGGRTNLQRWANAVDCTSARAGLLLADDLEAVHKMLALEDPVRAEARFDDLLVFATSDRYGKIRRQLGIAVGS